MVKAKSFFLALLPFLAVWLVFSFSIPRTEFVWDDVPLIQENSLLRGWKTLPQLLTTGYWQSSRGTATNLHEYRPALLLSFLLNEQVAGLRPWAFHLVNVFIHSANAFLLFFLLRGWMNERKALWASLFFAVLPVHAETVASITARSELQCLFFLLLTWLQLQSKRRLTLGAGISFALALLTKESAIVFPFIWWLSERCFGEQSEPNNKRQTFLALLAFAVCALGLRALVLGGQWSIGHNYFEGRSFLTRWLTLAHFALTYYATMLTTGFRVFVDYSRPLIADSTWRDGAAWGALLAWVGLLGMAAQDLWSKRSGFGFWVAFGFLFILPTSNLLLPLDTLGAPRFLYAASIAWAVALATLLARLSKPWKTTVLSLLILAFYGRQAWTLQRQWCSGAELRLSMLKNNPRSERSWVESSVFRMKRGEWKKAEQDLTIAKRLNPKNPDIAYNLGTALIAQKKYDEAKTAFEEAVVYAPTDPDAQVQLGLVQESLKNPREAFNAYRRALILRPWDPAANYNMARLLVMAGKVKEGAKYYEKFLHYAPEDPQAPTARQVLGLIYKDHPEFQP